MTTVNLLKPKVSFCDRDSVLCKARFAQPRFAQSSPKINLVPLFLATSSTLPSREEGALLWELVRLLDSGQPKSEAVLAYLAKAEAREANPHLADDLRISWKCVLNAALGVGDPWGFAFWSYFGKNSAKALRIGAERDRLTQDALERCAEMVRRDEQLCVDQTAVAANAARRITFRNPTGQSQPAACLQQEGPTRCREIFGETRSGSQTPQTESVTNLYDSGREILALPPKKPVHSIRPRKKVA